MFVMLRLLALLLGLFRRLVRSRRDLLLEDLALRQQLMVFKRRNSRSKIGGLDKLFCWAFRRICPQWEQAVRIVSPETVVRRHRTGFRLYWTSCAKRGVVSNLFRSSSVSKQLSQGSHSLQAIL
jgi:hypothetical protein